MALGHSEAKEDLVSVIKKGSGWSPAHRESETTNTKTNLKKQEEAELQQGHSHHTGHFMTGGEDPTVETKVRGQGSSSVGANRLG